MCASGCDWFPHACNALLRASRRLVMGRALDREFVARCACESTSCAAHQTALQGLLDQIYTSIILLFKVYRAHVCVIHAQSSTRVLLIDVD